MAAGAAANRPGVEFFFDCRYLADHLTSIRLEEAVLRAGARIEFRPILRPAVTGEEDAFGGPRAGARAAYSTRSTLAWASFLGVPVRGVDARAGLGDAAQRLAIVAARSGRTVSYLRAVRAAFFEAAADWGDEAAIADAARAAGVPSRATAAAASDPTITAELQRNSRDLVATGGFDSATMVAGGALYFGCESVALVEAALARLAGMRLVLPGDHGGQTNDRE